VWPGYPQEGRICEKKGCGSCRSAKNVVNSAHYLSNPPTLSFELPGTRNGRYLGGPFVFKKEKFMGEKGAYQKKKKKFFRVKTLALPQTKKRGGTIIARGKALEKKKKGVQGSVAK